MEHLFSGSPLKVFPCDRSFLIISGKMRSHSVSDSQLVILVRVDVISQGLMGILKEGSDRALSQVLVVTVWLRSQKKMCSVGF